MTDANSPIIGNYPLNFHVDQEGKRNEWEGVVCIPFIDVQQLLSAARSIDTATMSQVERDRNSHGHILIFRHDKGAGDFPTCSCMCRSLVSMCGPTRRAVSAAIILGSMHMFHKSPQNLRKDSVTSVL